MGALQKRIGDGGLVVAASCTPAAGGSPTGTIRHIPTFTAGITPLPFQIGDKLRPALAILIYLAEFLKTQVLRKGPGFPDLADIMLKLSVVLLQEVIYRSYFPCLRLQLVVGNFELVILLFDERLLLQQFGSLQAHLLFQRSV